MRPELGKVFISLRFWDDQRSQDVPVLAPLRARAIIPVPPVAAQAPAERRTGLRVVARTVPLRIAVGGSCFGKAQFFAYRATPGGLGRARDI